MAIPSDLLEAARAVRLNAYAPYSSFFVGAALRMRGSDQIFVGCNVENASYGATMCAERVAIFSAVAASSQAKPRLKELVVVGKEIIPPCGLCLQVISEFADEDTLIHLASVEEEGGSYRLSELMPKSFSQEHL